MTTIARSRSPQPEIPACPIATETVPYQVVHWIRGLFRIRIPRLGFDAEYGARLLYIVGSLPAGMVVPCPYPPSKTHRNFSLNGKPLAPIIRCNIFRRKSRVLRRSLHGWLDKKGRLIHGG